VAPHGELRVNAGVVCLQVKLCDPHMSPLEVRFLRRCTIQIDVCLYLPPSVTPLTAPLPLRSRSIVFFQVPLPLRSSSSGFRTHSAPLSAPAPLTRSGLTIGPVLSTFVLPRSLSISQYRVSIHRINISLRHSDVSLHQTPVKLQAAFHTQTSVSVYSRSL